LLAEHIDQFTHPKESALYQADLTNRMDTMCNNVNKYRHEQLKSM